MQLITVTVLKESAEAIAAIFRASSVTAFSATDIAGFRKSPEQDLSAEWFGAGDPAFESVMFFSFTEPESAAVVMQKIRQWNEEEQKDFPARAFLLPVIDHV